MISNLTLLVSLALIPSAPAPKPETSEDELAKLQGEWVVVKKAWVGPPYETLNSVASISRDNLSFTDRVGGVQGTDRYKIKRIKSGEIDLIKVSRPAEGELHVGIYSLDGDTLKICFAVDGPLGLDDPPERPTKYESPKESPKNWFYMVFFLERKKEKK